MDKVWKVRSERTIISIAGHIGGGKSAVCKELQEATGFDVLSTGAILRRIAADRGMSPLQMNDYARMDRAVDDEIDGYLVRLGSADNSVILDSRMAWHFLPNSLKVYLVVDPLVAAERVAQAGRAEEQHVSTEAALEANQLRQEYEKERFDKLYGVKCDLWRNYDLVVDSTRAMPLELSRIILEATSRTLPNRPECWLSPSRLYPTQLVATPAAHYGGPPIRVAVSGGQVLIVDGHQRVSAALGLGLNVVPCELVAFEMEDVRPGLPVREFAENAVSAGTLHDWESAHGFRYSAYPEWVKVGAGG